MAKDDSQVTLIAVGDVDASGEDAAGKFDLVRSILREGDVTFGQLEMPLANSGTQELAGGLGFRNANSLVKKNPRNSARVLAETGFDVMSHAGNHVMDLGEENMFETMDAIAEVTDIKLIGVGRDRDEARSPAIFEVKGTRIGFLAYCSVPIRNSWAETRELADGRRLIRGGVNPLRAHTSYEEIDYQPANRPRVISFTDPRDLADMLEDIERLRPLVDTVVVSCHWGVHFEPATIAMYQVEAGHAAVDAGADLILGHHPHLIKGIEIYRGAPILYGMPNFQLTVWDENGVVLDPARTGDGNRSYIARITLMGGRVTRMVLIPCWLENSRRQPEVLASSDPRAQGTLEYLEWVCANNTPRHWGGTTGYQPFPPFDTKFSLEDEGIVVAL